MNRDVFYFGEKPNVHPKERYAYNLTDATKRSKTEHFWIINEHCKYEKFDWNFDFDFLDDDSEQKINVWPSIYQKNSGTMLCSKHAKSDVIYRHDVTPLSTTKLYSPDIIFMSNGEECQEENFEQLIRVTKNLPNKVKKIENINGRVKSFHAAAEEAESSWFYIVFAKLFINDDFKFDYVFDYNHKDPKHYIFYALNPVNGLIYGHQSLVLYNRRLVLETSGKELDFTMESKHAVVEQLVGTAKFNCSSYTTWKTAFRECIKLCNQTDEASKERLNVWLTKAEGDFAEYCLLGSKDALEYYNIVNGNYEKLMLTYEWDWLENYYKTKY
jgi:hypothetical protein